MEVDYPLGDSVPVASQAQAEAGSDQGVYMDPLRVAQAIAALGGGGGTTDLLDSDLTGVTVVNSAAETAIYSFSIPGGTLSSGRILRCVVAGTILNNSGGGLVLTLRLKYGSTTIYADSPALFTSSAVRMPFRLEFDIADTGASQQTLNGFFAIGNTSAVSTGYGDLASSAKTFNPIHGTSAENEASALTLQATAQWSGADPATDIVSTFSSLLAL